MMNTIPQNTTIYSSGRVSKWNGFLSVVYDYLGFDPKSMTRKYIVEYISNKKNEKIKVTSENEWIVGKCIKHGFDNEKMIENEIGGNVFFNLLPPETYWIKQTFDTLRNDEKIKYVNFIENNGYINNTNWQIPKPAYQYLFKNGYAALEDKDIDLAKKISRVMSFTFGKFDERDIKKIKGVFTLSKNKLKSNIYTLKWIIHKQE